MKFIKEEFNIIQIIKIILMVGFIIYAVIKIEQIISLL